MSRRRSAGGVLEYSKMPAEVSGQSTGVLRAVSHRDKAVTTIFLTVDYFT
jgi:hypothetical protein